MTDKHERIGFQLKCINHLIHRKLDNRFAKAGLSDLSGMQGPMLSFIIDESKKKDVFQRDVEKAFNIRRSTATVMLQNLEQKGMLERISVENDLRLKKIVVTEKAIKYNKRIHEQIDCFNEELEKDLSDAEKETFSLILQKIKDNLDGEI